MYATATVYRNKHQGWYKPRPQRLVRTDLELFEGKLVEIHSWASGEVPCLQGGEVISLDIQPNGKKGLALECTAYDKVYSVVTFDNLILRIPEANLKEFIPSPAEAGGFDLFAPFMEEGDDTDWSIISRCLKEKGYCVVQMRGSEKARQFLSQHAKQRNDYYRPASEYERGMWGRKNQSKIAMGPFFHEAVRPYVDKMHSLISEVWSFTSDLGFVPKTELFGPTLRTYCKSKWERDRMSGGMITEDSVMEGGVEIYLDFVRHRKLCFMYWIDNSGGTVELHRDPLTNSPDVKIPIGKEKLLIFCHDMFSYSYKARGENVALQSWVMEEPPIMEIDDLQCATRAEKDAQVGLATWKGTPEGFVTHIQAAHCQFPACANSFGSYFSELKANTDSFFAVPLVRWDHSLYYSEEEGYPGKACTRHAGWVSDLEVTTFDNEKFGVSTEMAYSLTAHFRVAMETAASLVHICGLDPNDLRKDSQNDTQIAYYLGDCSSDSLGPVKNNMDHKMVGKAPVGIVHQTNIIASILGFTGPAMAVDTACSSSMACLCCIHAAYKQRQVYRENPSWAGRDPNSTFKRGISQGIQIYTAPFSFIGLSAARMLGSGGRSFTFDQSANGYNRGEGSGAIMLLYEMDRTESEIGCILGTMCGQDGRSATLTAPNGPSQSLCMKMAQKDAFVEPLEVMFNENHGTGTALGDPIEVGSCANVMRKGRFRPMAIGSGKTHNGHLEGGAGTVGQLKILNGLTHSCWIPNVHLRVANSHFDVAGFPAHFPTEVTDLGSEVGIKGANGFGFGGTNTHIVVWSRCLSGNRPTGLQKNLDTSKLTYVTVPCPQCLGPMDWLSGSAVYPDACDRTVDSSKLQKAAIRTEFATYDLCSYCYEGEYEYLTGLPEDIKNPGKTIYICGTWNAFSEMDEMTLGSDGSYEYVVKLGDTCIEGFYFTLEKDYSQAIYPIDKRAGQMIRVVGPDQWRNGRAWSIDGRKSEATVFVIRFTWMDGRRSVGWEPATAERHLNRASTYTHRYFIYGTWNGERAVKMNQNSEDPNLWEYTVRMHDPDMECQWHFRRDRDKEQMIYPEKTMKETPTTMAVLGPDHAGEGKKFGLQGIFAEPITFQLRFSKGDITVSAVRPKDRSISWSSKHDFRHRYHLVGTHTHWEIDEAAEFLPTNDVDVYLQYIEVKYVQFTEFQILVDGDWKQRLHPISPHGTCGQSIMCGPDAVDNDLCWGVSMLPGVKVEIKLDLRREVLDRDRRAGVTSRIIYDPSFFKDYFYGF